MKKQIALALAATFIIAGAAQAQEMKKCDEETMAMVMTEVDGADAANKEKAMMEFDMAKTAMEANNADECGMHLDMASKAAKGM